jgi:pyruvate dehydrogenase E1 component alpha subunit
MARYRPKEEVEFWLAHDPLDVLSSHLLEEGSFTQTDIDETRSHVEKQLEDSIEWAKERTHPEPADALNDVYVDSIGGAALR